MKYPLDTSTFLRSLGTEHNLNKTRTLLKYEVRLCFVGSRKTTQESFSKVGVGDGD
jgi:hypothetical protein